MQAPDDNALMFEVQAGRLDRLGLLFERHHRSLYGYFLRLTRHPARSEDLVQEVFLRVLTYRRSFRGEGSFKAWLFMIARRVYYDDGRTWRREPPAEETTHLEATSPDPAPLDRLAQHDAEAALHAALDALPETKREVVILSRFHGLKYEEIAELLGCTVGAVKVRVHRALKDLRNHYARLTREEIP